MRHDREAKTAADQTFLLNLGDEFLETLDRARKGRDELGNLLARQHGHQCWSIALAQIAQRHLRTWNRRQAKVPIESVPALASQIPIRQLLHAARLSKVLTSRWCQRVKLEL